MKIEVGKEYEVEHRSWGSFRIRVEEVDGNYVLGTITHGVFKHPRGPDRYVGDGVWLDTSWSLTRLTPVE